MNGDDLMKLAEGMQQIATATNAIVDAAVKKDAESGALTRAIAPAVALTCRATEGSGEHPAGEVTLGFRTIEEARRFWLAALPHSRAALVAYTDHTGRPAG